MYNKDSFDYGVPPLEKGGVGAHNRSVDDPRNREDLSRFNNSMTSFYAESTGRLDELVIARKYDFKGALLNNPPL
jgi:hypothetical protein